jgi:AraC-like DNA-binding protein
LLFVSPSFLRAVGSELSNGRYGVREAPSSYPSAIRSGLWLDAQHVDAFVCQVLRAAGDDALGIWLGQRAPFTMLQIVGHLLLECTSPSEAFYVLRRYAPILFDGVTWHMAESDLDMELGFRLSIPLPERSQRFWGEWMLGVFSRAMSELLGAPPAELGCAHGAPDYGSRYAECFPCPVRFAEPTYWMRFPLQPGGFEIPARDPALFCVLKEAAEQALSQRASKRSLTEQVRDALERQNDLSNVDLERLAAGLGLTRRSLRRRLEAEGQTVSNLIRELRCEFAKRALREGGESAVKIAGRLGYSEPSAFHRAFRRWTGQTPAKYRNGTLQAP